MRSISKQFGMSSQSLIRHRDSHLSPAIVQAEAERGAEHVQSLVDRIEALLGEADGLLRQAKETGKINLALSAIREMRGILELFGKASGQLQPEGPQSITVNLLSTTDWLVLRAAVTEALVPFPDARAAVAARLAALDAGSPPAIEAHSEEPT